MKISEALSIIYRIAMASKKSPQSGEGAERISLALHKAGFYIDWLVDVEKEGDPINNPLYPPLIKIEYEKNFGGRGEAEAEEL